MSDTGWDIFSPAFEAWWRSRPHLDATKALAWEAWQAGMGAVPTSGAGPGLQGSLLERAVELLEETGIVAGCSAIEGGFDGCLGCRSRSFAALIKTRIRQEGASVLRDVPAGYGGGQGTESPVQGPTLPSGDSPTSGAGEPQPECSLCAKLTGLTWGQVQYAHATEHTASALVLSIECPYCRAPVGRACVPEKHALSVGIICALRIKAAHAIAVRRASGALGPAKGTQGPYPPKKGDVFVTGEGNRWRFTGERLCNHPGLWQSDMVNGKPHDAGWHDDRFKDGTLTYAGRRAGPPRSSSPPSSGATGAGEAVEP